MVTRLQLFSSTVAPNSRLLTVLHAKLWNHFTFLEECTLIPLRYFSSISLLVLLLHEPLAHLCKMPSVFQYDTEQARSPHKQHVPLPFKEGDSQNWTSNTQKYFTDIMELVISRL